ncbi:hypothetical protein [Spirosoma montaniterrae]|uniref:Glycosyltransferase RgtA/B/C/D-like domain-containing protein n=1 Tax=Spirosoma montaniterrae TaxID=1178516 RepID=A0A1P9X1V0_9BACT|nr:hypothetical protein [Spirosoma montaniterrae]AQG81600.1 hypothetical protein AWR27_21180 [Spirosoma montaniterrae]
MLRFDSNPFIYWLIVYGLCWLLGWVTVQLRLSRPAFAVAALGLLFLLRLPSIVYNNEVNPDESQMIAQALTLRQDPVYFRSVDGTTGGPLDSYFLILPTFVGLPFDFISAHLTAYALVALSLWLFFLTAQRWFGETPARLALLPLVFMLGLTQNGDFLHYNSELVAIVLLGWSTLLYAVLLTETRPPIWRLALIGFLLGMIPYGKLQGVPIAAVIGLFAGLVVLAGSGLTSIEKTVRLAALAVGGLAFSALFIGFMWLNGMYDDFVTFYIIGNFQYASDSNQLLSLLRLPAFFQKGEAFGWFVTLVLAVVMVAVVMARRRAVRVVSPGWQKIGFVVLLVLATIFSITRTGSEYVHYLFFLIGPLLLLLARAWDVLLQSTPQNRRHWWPLGLLAIFLLVFGVQMGLRIAQKQPMNTYVSEWQGGWAIQQSPVSKEIAKYARPGEKLAVWGWRCDYYVQTQMPQGVAENHTIRSAFAHPLQATYQQRYVRNMMRSKPAVFVDAVGKNNLWMTDRATQGHELVKPLQELIKSQYQYVGMVHDTRIFVRNDRAKSPLSQDRNQL